MPQAGRQPGHRHRGLHGPRQPVREAVAAGAGRRLGRRGRRREEALLPPLPAGGDERRLPQPHQAELAGLPRGLPLQAPARLGAARAPRRGRHRHHRLPRRPRAPVAPAGRRAGRTGEGGPAPGHLRARQPLRRDPGPRHPGAAPDEPDAAGDRPQDPGAAARHQRQPLRAPGGRRRPRRPALRADELDDRRPEPVQVLERQPLPEVGVRDAPALQRGAGELRQHALGRRALQRRDRVRQAEAAVVPAAGRLHLRHRLPAPPHLRGRLRPLGPEPLARGGRAARLRARRHRPHGLQLLLPHRVGPDRPRPPGQHPGGPGPWLGGRLRRGLHAAHHRPRPDQVRPAVRAVPQPEPHLHARHRHGLRRPLPGRDDPVRGRALRPRPRGPDRHLLHHQGPGRRARRRPGARLPLRRRRSGGQGHAAAGHGPRHAALRLPRGAPEVHRRVQGRRRAARDVRRRPRREEGRRRGQGARGPPPGRRHPRRRRGDHRRAAHRVPAHPAQAGAGQGHRGRPDRHPVRDARGRGPRPPQDGLPGAAQPLGDRERPRPDRDLDRPAPRHRQRAARRPADLRPAAAGRLDRRVPARGRPHAGAHALPGADRVRGRRRPRGPVPARAHGGQHAQRLRRPEERPAADRLPARGPRGGARRHLRPDDLPGVGDAGGPEGRRLLAGRG